MRIDLLYFSHTRFRRMFPFMPLIGTGRRMGEPSIPHVWMTKSICLRLC